MPVTSNQLNIHHLSYVIPFIATRKSTLIFCVDIAHVVALTQTFRRHGIDARHVYSQTPVAERKALIASFKTGQYPVLINCGQNFKQLTVMLTKKI